MPLPLLPGVFGFGDAGLQLRGALARASHLASPPSIIRSQGDSHGVTVALIPKEALRETYFFQVAAFPQDPF